MATSEHALPAVLQRVLVPISGAIIGIALWWGIVEIFDVPDYVAPTPGAVFETLVNERTLLLENLWPTAYESILGFAIGNVIAILAAIAFVHSRSVERSLFPVAVFIQTLPLVAVAPILILIFGQGPASKIIIAALIVLFPTLVNMVKGFHSISAQHLELFRVMSASKPETFWKARTFASLPFLFTSLKIASTTAVIGAIVAEWVGAGEGLGYLIINATYNFQTGLLYATMIVASLLALSMFAIVTLIEKLVVRWDVER